jgi:hypothetical protein
MPARIPTLGRLALCSFRRPQIHFGLSGAPRRRESRQSTESDLDEGQFVTCLLNLTSKTGPGIAEISDH